MAQVTQTGRVGLADVSVNTMLNKKLSDQEVLEVRMRAAAVAPLLQAPSAIDDSMLGRFGTSVSSVRRIIIQESAAQDAV